jgi:N-methylhydantoinase A
LSAAGDALDDAATAELRDAGVPDDRVRREWFINMVFPGQTFDVSIPVARVRGEPITTDAFTAAVDEFHRRNAEARLIESRAEEPLVRGVRLVAIGETDHPALAAPETPAVPPAGGRRRVHIAGDWVEADVVDVAAVTPASAPVTGPAVIELAFSTLVLRPGDVARATDFGDVLVDLSR